MLIPALEGTRQILRAAQKEASVKRVVLTSSFAAVLDFDKLTPETTFTEKDWNPATYDSAKKSDQPPYIYCASKKIAEEEAWKIAKEPETKWQLCTIAPPMILGPPRQTIESMDSINTSAGAVWAVVDAKEIPDTSFPVWTDVRDIADVHVKGATEEIAKGKRCALIVSVGGAQADFPLRTATSALLATTTTPRSPPSLARPSPSRRAASPTCSRLRASRTSRPTRPSSRRNSASSGSGSSRASKTRSARSSRSRRSSRRRSRRAA